MTNNIQPSTTSDARLVALCIEGDRGAFGTIVQRYQALICALSYAGCGDVHRSEDLAQETFLQAWRHLPDLKEPALLRSWLCSIARNLVRSAHRKEGRAPATCSQPADETLGSPSPTPPENAISKEEQILLWETLERLPEEYREPLVLYYRQEESLAAVAAALDMSQQTARQRLSRGRAMLTQRIERLISRGLRVTAPTKAFTLAVIASLPGVAVSASAATVGATVVKGGASAKAAASAGFMASSLLGPLIGLAGGYLGYRIGLAQTITTQERQFIRRFFWGIILIVGAFTAVFLGSTYWTKWLGLNPPARAVVMSVIAIGYAALLLTLCFKYQRRIRRLRQQAIADNPQMLAKAREMSARWNMEYRSGWTLLGLPLIHVNIGGTPDGRIPVAKGWIAIGAKAYGVLFAFGGVAIGGISFGGMSIGLLTWGGFAIGAFTWGGFGLGIWALGGLAIGWKAIGGCALGWSAAQGGAAIARDFAQGAVASATHANDAAAETFSRDDWFFQFARGFLMHAHWAWLVGIVPLIPMATRWMAYRRLSKTGRGATPSS